MCVICISNKGVRQPNAKEIMDMWTTNPHGGGYMYLKGNDVVIKKGFMTYQAYMTSIAEERFTKDDIVIYHLRISTQGGINQEMTQPFAYTNELERTKELDAVTKLGIAHNGIIPLTSYKDKEYSDTAHFIAEYLPLIVRKRSELYKPETQKIISELIQSKMAFLDSQGNIILIGSFTEDKDGLIYSNMHHVRNYKYYSFK